MGKIKRSEAQKYIKQQKRQAQMQSAAASQKEEGQKMPENRRRERKAFEKRQQTEMKLGRDAGDDPEKCRTAVCDAERRSAGRENVRRKPGEQRTAPD